MTRSALLAAFGMAIALSLQARQRPAPAPTVTPDTKRAANLNSSKSNRVVQPVTTVSPAADAANLNSSKSNRVVQPVATVSPAAKEERDFHDSPKNAIRNVKARSSYQTPTAAAGRAETSVQAQSGQLRHKTTPTPTPRPK